MRVRRAKSSTSARSAGSRPEVVEHRRPQQVAQVAHLRQRAAHHLARLGAAVEVELDLDRGEHLPGLVVQLAGDAPALVLLRAQQQARELLELAAARLERAAPLAEHQEQRADRGRDDEQHVGEHAVQHAGAERAQQRVVEVVEAPQRERPGQHGGPGRVAPARWRQNTMPVHSVTPDSSTAAESPAMRMSRMTKIAIHAQATPPRPATGSGDASGPRARTGARPTAAAAPRCRSPPGARTARSRAG